MTESPRLFHLGPPLDDLCALAGFLRDSQGTDVVVQVDPDRPLTTPEAQLLLAASQDPAGPSSLRLVPDSGHVADGLRRLGLDGRLGLAA